MAPPAPNETDRVLAELLTVYGEMVERARVDDWEGVLERAAHRAELAGRLPQDMSGDTRRRARLEALKELNDELERQVLAGRGKTLAALGKVREGQRMHRAYADAKGAKA